MEKKIIKIIYKLRVQKNSSRKIKVLLHSQYSVDLKLTEIENIVRKIKYTREKYSSTEKNIILSLYSNFVNTDKLIIYLNRKYGYDLNINRIKDLACRNGCKKKVQNMYKQSFVSRNDEYEICRLYNEGYTSHEIASMYSYKSRNSILKKLEKMNCKRRDWNIMQQKSKTYSSFSMKYIDSKLKAYFLGLILTDGYINEQRKYIGIDLCDKDVIEFLSKEIQVKFNVINCEVNKDKYRIILYGENYVDQFKRLGASENKTFKVTGPCLHSFEKKYINYIIRGIIDGDGWIRKDGKEFFICSASKYLIKWCEDQLEELGFENMKVRYIRNEYSGIYIIRSARKKNIELLKKIIYNCEFGMNRKYNLLQ